jgi:hypothetical protein
MDRKLTFSQKKLEEIIKEFESISNKLNHICFEIWTTIPEVSQKSYFDNEQLINPEIETFEIWKTKLSRRPNPIYSVAKIGNEIISSIYGAEVCDERIMNLWATKSEFQQKKIGKAVLLNFVKYTLERNQNIPIKAWDVTSKKVDNTLIKLGFE